MTSISREEKSNRRQHDNNTPPPSNRKDNDNIKNLGRKARARRQEELLKRPEIVRLEYDAVDPAATKKRTAGAAPKKKQQQQKRPPKRTRKPQDSYRNNDLASSSKKRRSSKSSTAGAGEGGSSNKNSNTIDTRTPLVDHLAGQQDDSDDEDKNNYWSSTVRVHGLPVGTTRGDLIRFFSGLDPTRVFVLPTTGMNQNHSTTIVGWDAKDNNNNGSSSFVLERYPTWFRVFVKFASAPVASLAVQRSGEVMYMGSKNNTTGNTTGTRQGATIAVTQIPKSVATFLLRNLVT